MKKFIAIAAAALLMAGLSACNGKNTAATGTDGTEGVTYREIETLSSVEVTDETKILVAYFDPDGSVKAAANEIAAQTGADIFELKTEIDYSGDALAVVRNEISDGYEIQPDIKNGVLAESYDLVFLGFPAPDGLLPAEIYSFININDLRDKVIIPFVTDYDGDCPAVTDVIDSISHGSSQALMFNTEKDTDINAWLTGLGF